MNNKSEYIEAEQGYEIQVGDKILIKSFVSTSVYTVRRVTAKYSFVKYNEHAEGRFPRTYSWGFQSLPKERWNMTEYKVYRKSEQLT